MPTSRRAFLEQFAAGSLGVGATPALLSALTAPSPAAGLAGAAAERWDVSWVPRVQGRYKAIFDVPEIDSGYGVWRASIWMKQYHEVLGAKPSDMTAVVVLRHHGIALAMQQAYWEKYGIGKKSGATHPLTEQPTDRNPALLSSAKDGIPTEFDPLALDRAIARGVIALACDLALQDCVGLIAKTDNVTPEAARKVALGYMVPGVILQPSGVFAALRAQHAGCAYLRAS
jgi:hypothetical protein